MRWWAILAIVATGCDDGPRRRGGGKPDCRPEVTRGECDIGPCDRCDQAGDTWFECASGWRTDRDSSYDAAVDALADCCAGQCDRY